MIILTEEAVFVLLAVAIDPSLTRDRASLLAELDQNRVPLQVFSFCVNNHLIENTRAGAAVTLTEEGRAAVYLYDIPVEHIPRA